MDDERRSRVTPAYFADPRAAATRRRGWVTEVHHFSFGRANGSRRDACRPLNRPTPGKHQLCGNPENRGVELVEGLATA